MDLAYERTPIGSIVDVVRGVIAAVAAKKGINLEVDVAPDAARGLHRPGPHQAGALQPDLERHQVHAARRGGAPHRRAPRTGTSSSRSPTPASASRARICRGCSASSSSSRSRAASAPRGPASASRSRAASSSSTAARSRSRASSARARRSPSTCPCARPTRPPGCGCRRPTRSRGRGRLSPRGEPVADAWVPAEARVVPGVLDRAAGVGRAQRPGGVEHDRELVGRARADAPLVGAGVRAVDDAGRVVREAARADPLARGEAARARRR